MVRCRGPLPSLSFLPILGDMASSGQTQSDIGSINMASRHGHKPPLSKEQWFRIMSHILIGSFVGTIMTSVPMHHDPSCTYKDEEEPCKSILQEGHENPLHALPHGANISIVKSPGSLGMIYNLCPNRECPGYRNAEGQCVRSKILVGQLKERPCCLKCLAPMPWAKPE